MKKLCIYNFRYLSVSFKKKVKFYTNNCHFEDIDWDIEFVKYKTKDFFSIRLKITQRGYLFIVPAVLKVIMQKSRYFI